MLLERIKSYFNGVGNIYTKEDKLVIELQVSSIKDLKIILTL